MKRKIKKNNWIIAFLILAFLFLNVFAANSISEFTDNSQTTTTDNNYNGANESFAFVAPSLDPGFPDLDSSISTAKNTYALGETVTINVQSTYAHTITIYDEKNKFVLLETEKSAAFVPENTGEYTVVYSSQTQQKNITFFVNDKKNEEGNGKIKTDKKQYLLGEQVNILIPNLSKNQTISITAQGKTYRYIGELKDVNPFFPSLKGTYNVGLFENDYVVDTSQFEVTDTLPYDILSEKKYIKPYVVNPQKLAKVVPRIKDSKDKKINSRLIIDDSFVIDETNSREFDLNDFAQTIEFTPSENIHSQKTIENIRFNKVNLKNGFNLGFEDLPFEKANIYKKEIRKAFAIDPTAISFENATVTSVAQGNELYKCADWNFTQQFCFGFWTKIMDIVPGETYSFTITPNDPAYAESTYNPDVCYNEKTAINCTGTELSAIQSLGGGTYSFNRQTGSPIRVSFPNETKLIDQITNCTVHVVAQDNENNLWTLQFGNYTENQWNTGTAKNVPVAQTDVTWDCTPYFTGVFNDSLYYNKFGVRITSGDTAPTAVAYIDWVWISINFTLRDVTAPYWSNNITNPTNPAIYSPGATYWFNITWNDNEGIRNVWFENNFTKTSANYSANGNASSIYFYNFTGLSAGIYYWRSRGNDTSNNTNTTPIFYYTINKAQSLINLTINGTSVNWTFNENDTINLTGKLMTGESAIYLYVNGSAYNSGLSQISNITKFAEQGTYNITAYYLTSENYTSNYSTYWIKILDVTPPQNITNLNATKRGYDWIYWNWTNPPDTDFNYTEVWINNVWHINISANYYNATNLDSNTTYNISLRPVDLFGNIGQWTNGNGTTLELIDLIAPEITNVSNISITDSTANITWNTNENARSFVFYGTTSGTYTNNVSRIVLEKYHNLLISGLKPDTIYYYVVNSTDGAANSNQTIEFNFKTGADTTLPYWQNNQTSPSSYNSYSQATQYRFNITWLDNGYLDKVKIENDFGGTLKNDSITGNASNIYYYDLVGLAAGTYNWKMYANDSRNNQNATDQFTYVVNKTQSAVTLLLNGTNADYLVNEGNYVNITGKTTLGESYIELYLDDSIINNGTSYVTNSSFFNIPGSYVANITHPNTQNYTFGSSIHTIIVNDTKPPFINLTSPLNNSPDYDGDLVFWYYVNDTGTLDNCSIYLNGTFIESKKITFKGANSFTINSLANGNYTWNVTCSDIANNTGWSQPWRFEVRINQFRPDIYPITCVDQGGACLVTSINFTDGVYLTHGALTKTGTREQYVYVNFTNPNIAAGSTIHYMNITYNKSQNTIQGNLRLEWWNTSSSAWVQICQVNYGVAGNPTPWDSVTCNFNTSGNPLPTIQQINNNLPIRAAFYYSGGSANVNYFTEFTHIFLMYTEDVTPPTVELNDPPTNTFRNIGDVMFKYTPSDANLQNCTLWIGNETTWAANNTDPSPKNGALDNFTLNLGEGFYFWNVMCADVAKNQGMAPLNFTLNITNPDLEVLSTYITFSNSTPIEGDNITIFALVKNRGNVNATNSFKVGFYLGDPLFGGIQISDNQTINSLGSQENSTVNVSFIVPGGGTYRIFALADVPLETNGTVKETNENNNKNFTLLNIPIWQYYYGNTSSLIFLDQKDNSTLIAWNASSSSGTIYVADTDSSISWFDLKAIGINITNNTDFYDFYEVDIALNSTNASDSVNRTYTYNGKSIYQGIFQSYGINITNASYVNSTINSNFITSIMWDSSDGNNYDGTQDLVFATKINRKKQGKYGIYDYEIRVPANLKKYKGSTNTLAFYTYIE